MFLEVDNLINPKISVFIGIGEIIDGKQTAVGGKLNYNFSEVQNGEYFLTIEKNKNKKTVLAGFVHD